MGNSGHHDDTTTPNHNPLAESPWFWVWLFAGWALIALFLVAPKYVRRQGRLGLQQEGREIAWRQRVEGHSDTVAPFAGQPDDMGEREPAVTPDPARTTPSMLPLLMILLGLAAVAGIVLAIRNARQARGPEAASVADPLAESQGKGAAP